jgi:hypothetical protein
MDEKDLNITYIIGIFIGVVVVVAQIFFALRYGLGPLAIPTAFLLALLEVLIYRAYLNRTKLRGRPDQPFMAFSLALGISGAYLLFIAGQYFVRAGTSAEGILGLLLLALGVPLTRAAVALHFSSARSSGSSLSRALLLPVALLTVFNLTAFFYMIGDFDIYFSLPGAVLGIGYFFFTYRLLSKVPDMEHPSADDAGP